MGEALKDIISRIRKEKEAAGQVPTPQPPVNMKEAPLSVKRPAGRPPAAPAVPAEEEAEDFAEDEEEFKEDAKPAETPATETTQLTDEQIVAEEINMMQNNGIYRREVLAALHEISESLKIIANVCK